MPREPALQDDSEAGAQNVRRWSFIRGVVIGVAATAVLAFVAWEANRVLSPGARTFTTTCSGARVTGTIWVERSGVFTSVVVVDPKKRGWDIRWGDYSEELADSTMIPSTGADYSGSLVSATQALGDADDGTHRTAQVRPKRGTWCALHMHASALS